MIHFSQHLGPTLVEEAVRCMVLLCAYAQDLKTLSSRHGSFPFHLNPSLSLSPLLLPSPSLSLLLPLPLTVSLCLSLSLSLCLSLQLVILCVHACSIPCRTVRQLVAHSSTFIPPFSSLVVSHDSAAFLLSLILSSLLEAVTGTEGAGGMLLDLLKEIHSTTAMASPAIR